MSNEVAKSNMQHGTVEGTGAAINIACGFQPRVVKVFNIDGDAMLSWNDSMGDAAGFKTIAAGTTAAITTLGITPYAGTLGADKEGFTIGADTDVNVTAETMCWEAYR